MEVTQTPVDSDAAHRHQRAAADAPEDSSLASVTGFYGSAVAPPGTTLIAGKAADDGGRPTARQNGRRGRRAQEAAARAAAERRRARSASRSSPPSRARSGDDPDDHAASTSRAARLHALEVLVAVAIFVIVGALAMGGYNELRQAERASSRTAPRARARSSRRAAHGQDFASLEPRPVREPLGDSLRACAARRRAHATAGELTHSGWTNPAGVPRSTLQRVAYRLEDNKLHARLLGRARSHA